MNEFPDNHPFAIFNKNVYLVSGSVKMGMPIYIFRFDHLGILVEVHLNDKINGPHCRLYELKFGTRFDFDYDIVKSFADIYHATIDGMYEKAARQILMRVKDYETRNTRS